MSTFSEFIMEREQLMSTEEFEARGQARRQPEGLSNRTKVLIGLGLVTVGAAIGTVAFSSIDASQRVAGSNDEAFCVEYPMVRDASYATRLQAIRVMPDEFVDAATVALRAIPPAEGGGYQVLGRPC